MGDLSAGTAVDGADGQYATTLDADWQIWGPMGGYVASVALRASAREVDSTLRPASFTCQFVSTARFAPVAIDVSVRRSSSRAALVDARVSQDGNAILDAQAWFAAPSSVVEHDHVPRHRYGHPDDHEPISPERHQSPTAD